VSTITLKLLDQYWGGGSHYRDAEPDDVTSHGKVELLVGDVDLAGCDSPETDYGINQSAVRLLQTTFADHQPVPWRSEESYNPVFFHGCSIFGTCPNCVIDFRVQHNSDGTVLFDQFYVSGGSASDPKRFHDISARVSLLDYAQEVREFAAASLAFLPPVKGLEHERSYYRALLAEHEFLLSLLERSLQTGDDLSKYRDRASAFDVGSCHLPDRWRQTSPGMEHGG
jgi:hypothetical protein